MRKLEELGFSLVALGFLLAVASILALAAYSFIASPASVGFAGCVVIGFVPLCFGYGSSAGLVLALLAVALTALVALAVLAWLWLRPKGYSS
ncbi:TIGR00304 family membrane protein [Thermofilum pendens]|uniref:DUF131 domain-containing protein n=1 Tax=Thermofilum pendens (strain DSM 2475 / Hrk 5) TaxID=368408 RepID=A1S0C0_THEPD|nr:hypothetical protein [Thermofilum pendens]ABL78900.1 conserved hypothetical protein [Thermofilum pendens Hrk 5]